MADNFSAEDGRRITAIHNQLLSDLHSFTAVGDPYKAELRKALTDVIRSHLFDSDMAAALEANDPNHAVSKPIEAIIRNLYALRLLEPQIKAARDLLKGNEYSILQSMRAMEPRYSAIAWFFTGGSAKRAAASAYETLQRMSSGPYVQSIQHIRDEISKVNHIDTGAALADVQLIPAYYRDAIKEYAPFALHDNASIEQLSEITEAHKALTDAADKGVAAYNDAREMVKRYTQAIIRSDMIATLKDAPVEALKQEGDGLRIKPLRDAGFTTVADIYASSLSRLQSVRGIGDADAGTLRAAAIRYAQIAQNATKLRLNADHKTNDATQLLYAVYAYRQICEPGKKLEAFSTYQCADIRHDCNTLNHAGDGIVWLCSNTAVRQRILDAYNRAVQALRGDYAGTIRELCRNISLPPRPSSASIWADFSNDPVPYYNVIEEIVPGVLGNGDQLYGLPEDLAKEIQDECFFPDGLLCTLRRYQEWGVKYTLHQEKVLLGDEMGLGKTVQAIATMVSLRNTGSTHFMVVCPASVFENWCREITRFSKLSVYRVYGIEIRDAELQRWKKEGGVAVTTYETTAKIDLKDAPLTLLVVDEAHYLKNSAAKRTINVKKIAQHADRLMYMTGTPLENNVDEMIRLIGQLQPKLAQKVEGMKFMSAAPMFREAVAPVYYRRKREDVLTELPDKEEKQEWCVMGAEEERVYEASLYDHYMRVRRVSWNVDLKYSSKAARMKEIVEEARGDGRKTIVFSYFRETLAKVQACLEGFDGESKSAYQPVQCFGPITGDVSVSGRQLILDEFEKAPDGAVLVAQIEAGGTGLNIQAASVVILCEPQLKPSIENQAISRAYRMGQTRTVFVHRLLCSDSIDERITELLANKQAQFDAFADKSVAAEESVKIDDKTMKDLIREEIERINAKTGYKPPVTDDDAEDDTADVVFEDEEEAADNGAVETEFTYDTATAEKAAETTGAGTITIEVTEEEDSEAEDMPDMENEEPAEENTAAADEDKTETVIRCFRDLGVQIIDKREKGGCVWIEKTPTSEVLYRALTASGFKIGIGVSKKTFGDKQAYFISGK